MFFYFISIVAMSLANAQADYCQLCPNHIACNNNGVSNITKELGVIKFDNKYFRAFLQIVLLMRPWSTLLLKFPKS